MAWQIVEKDDFGTDWSAVRYHNAATTRYATEDDAIKTAKEYVSSRNVDNALAAAEKHAAAEAWMMTPDGIYLGNLDGKDWFVIYPKDIVDRKTGAIVAKKGDRVTDEKMARAHCGLEGKAQVAVRVLPGS